jgi:hypothetical protein
MTHQQLQTARRIILRRCWQRRMGDGGSCDREREDAVGLAVGAIVLRVCAISFGGTRTTRSPCSGKKHSCRR